MGVQLSSSVIWISSSFFYFWCSEHFLTVFWELALITAMHYSTEYPSRDSANFIECRTEQHVSFSMLEYAHDTTTAVPPRIYCVNFFGYLSRIGLGSRSPFFVLKVTALGWPATLHRVFSHISEYANFVHATRIKLTVSSSWFNLSLLWGDSRLLLPKCKQTSDDGARGQKCYRS